MSRFLDFNLSGIEPEEGAPLPERILSGSPEFRTWNLEENAEGTLLQAYGRVRRENGVSNMTNGSSATFFPAAPSSAKKAGSREVGVGDSFVIRPGFKGSWEVIETTRKEYVIRL